MAGGVMCLQGLNGDQGYDTDLILKHRQYPIAAGDAYNRITGQ